MCRVKSLKGMIVGHQLEKYDTRHSCIYAHIYQGAKEPCVLKQRVSAAGKRAKLQDAQMHFFFNSYLVLINYAQ